jgi:spore germination cell wall hydrolase CwlJ-like protein
MYLESKIAGLLLAVTFPFFTIDESYVMKLEQFFSKHNITEVSTQEIVTVEAVVTKESNYEQKLRCMTEVIYYEAGGEPFEGKKAVAQVVLNRKFDDRFPDNICDVVYEKTKRPGRTLCQFSWVCQNYKRVIEESAWRESKYIAEIALTSEVIHVKLASNRALFFHSTSVKPGWNYNRVSQIGNHIFYASLN